MKYPLLIAATVYALGLIVGDSVAAPVFPSLALAVVLCLLGLCLKNSRVVFVPLVLFAAGFCNQRLHVEVLSPHDLRRLAGTAPLEVRLSGTLTETPYQKTYERRHETAIRTLALLRVETMETRGGSRRPALGVVAVSTPGVLDGTFFAGQRLSVSGVLEQPPGPLAEGLFDYRTYLERQGIYYQLHVKSTNEWVLHSRQATLPVSDRFLNWAQRTLSRGMPTEDEPLRLLWAMTLGWKTALSGEISEPFMRSGTMHIFAISGLHIALIAGLLVALFRVFHVPRGVCGLFVIPLIWMYTGFTGWQASAIRSTVMMTIIIAGWALHRPSNLLNSLGAAALIILIWDPQQLFQASFQLSFFVVLSLGLFTPVLDLYRQKALAPDSFLPAELRPNWRKRLDLPLHWVTTSFVTSLAAWLGSIPLVAYYFHLFTPVSLIANLLVVPLSSAALASNMASLICGDWLPFCGELFNHAAWGFMFWMIRLSEW
ncbi:MAG TPA: ComEC/Rec2 family competence protein, partial [Candidatus Saccharimonadales bacterium]|nr:ComEC/Rec2 family competence protein [Candidatus Saccharimonadales bacterium]